MSEDTSWPDEQIILHKSELATKIDYLLGLKKQSVIEIQSLKTCLEKVDVEVLWDWVSKGEDCRGFVDESWTIIRQSNGYTYHLYIDEMHQIWRWDIDLECRWKRDGLNRR